MICLYRDSKVFVHCPSDVVTGGCELLHQLVDSLRNNGREAYVVYSRYGSLIPSDYQCYNIAIADDVDDNSHNIEVFPENMFNIVENCHHTQKFLWWLSVDNFYRYSESYLSINDLFRWNKKAACLKFLRRVKQYIKGNNEFCGNIKIDNFVSKGYACGYQSEYIHFHLKKIGFKELYPLQDFINDDHFEPIDIKERENIVLYNPNKGLEFTNKLIAASPDIRWIPITNLSRSEAIALFRKSKLYVDFGNHPGKDRLPRECAVNGCCVLTGEKGAASFFEDIPIPGNYKMSEYLYSVEDIVSRIRSILSQYEDSVSDFTYYKRKIRSEKAEFLRQVNNIFGKL